ncbi:MAG: aminofutalosine synthase MqnE [Thermodesulfovibrionia bacterium]|nr:aminofutalosine synthase MqnE [Thermodesulfovibrionia bacterium]
MSLKKIETKVNSGKRLTSEDAVTIFASDDIFTIGRLAHRVAYKKNRDRVHFVQNHHINPTNICVNRCKFCAFSRSKGEKGAYALSIKDILDKLRPHNSGLRIPYTEVHIVGGLHPDWPFEFYIEMLREIKKSFPYIHIKAFTAVEIDYFSNISCLNLTHTLKALKNAGLDSIPGGGAEIFNKRVRQKICPEKIDGKKWLHIMGTAHSVGIKSNATMLYGHLESYKHRIEHMLLLRELQDRTGGFQAFIPLPFHPANTRINGRGYTSGIDDIKTIAIARIFLDNFPHIKAYWIMLGEKIAQLALMFGADDLDGTVVEEKITHSAGALSEQALSRTALVNMISKAGKIPVERDSFYRPLKKWV